MVTDKDIAQEFAFSQAHRRASEAYIAAMTAPTAGETIDACKQADRFAREALLLAQTTHERAGVYGFLMATYGIRVLAEMGEDTDDTT